ncbi:hypothetical protein CCUS01_15228 [Colletotrichum cuscutae]|uniref:Uncharacterized protein n=4 Tax=Colletotrichum acutatum species complex TaxID=2707335 RepID=A0AAI9Y871_9PEZI|nr:hypothetical protein CCUS01_15228 [Colletotrichum cuscutae]
MLFLSSHLDSVTQPNGRKELRCTLSNSPQLTRPWNISERKPHPHLYQPLHIEVVIVPAFFPITYLPYLTSRNR